MFSFFGMFICLMLAFITSLFCSPFALLCFVLGSLSSWTIAIGGFAIMANDPAHDAWVKGRVCRGGSCMFCGAEQPQPASQGTLQMDSPEPVTLPAISFSNSSALTMSSRSSQGTQIDGAQETHQTGSTADEQIPPVMPQTPKLLGQSGLWVPPLTLDTEPLVGPPSPVVSTALTLWVSPYTLPKASHNNSAVPVAPQAILVVPNSAEMGLPETPRLAAISGGEVPELSLDDENGGVPPKYDIRFRRSSLL
ncbi:hypothetical protein Q7P37_011625 [Cladosporium fusiforme]